MWTSRAMIILSALLTSSLAACSGSGSAAGTIDIGPDPIAITTLPAPVAASPGSLPPPSTETPAVSPATPVTDAGPIGPPRYEVVARTLGDRGATLIVLLDRESYTTLSDIDLQNIVADVYDRFPPVIEAHIVDDPAAASLAAIEGPDAVAESDLADHYIARLEDGFRIVFLGRFEEFGTASLGS